MGYAFASMGGKGKRSNRWICMLQRHSHRVKSEVKAATGLDSIFPAVPSPPASLCSVPDSYAYNQLERHYPQRAVGVQPIEDPSIVADRDGYLFLYSYLDLDQWVQSKAELED